MHSDSGVNGPVQDPRDELMQYADAAERAFRSVEPPHEPFERYLSYNARFTACRNCLGPYPCKFATVAQTNAQQGES